MKQELRTLFRVCLLASSLYRGYTFWQDRKLDQNLAIYPQMTGQDFLLHVQDQISEQQGAEALERIK